MILTVIEIKTLAQFCGLVLTEECRTDHMEDESEIEVVDCPDGGIIDTDTAMVLRYDHVARFHEYPEEGVCGLGPEIPHTPAKPADSAETPEPIRTGNTRYCTICHKSPCDLTRPYLNGNTPKPGHIVAEGGDACRHNLTGEGKCYDCVSQDMAPRHDGPMSIDQCQHIATCPKAMADECIGRDCMYYVDTGGETSKGGANHLDT